MISKTELNINYRHLNMLRWYPFLIDEIYSERLIHDIKMLYFFEINHQQENLLQNEWSEDLFQDIHNHFKEIYKNDKYEN